MPYVSGSPDDFFTMIEFDQNERGRTLRVRSEARHVGESHERLMGGAHACHPRLYLEEYATHSKSGGQDSTCTPSS
jgi:hypothetical protein